MANLFRGIMRLSNVLFVIVLIQLLVVSSYSEAVDDNVELRKAGDIMLRRHKCPPCQGKTPKGFVPTGPSG